MIRCVTRSPLAPVRIAQLCVLAGLALAGLGCPGGGGGNGGGLAPQARRAAFQSPCAQNVITCTVSFPTAEVSVEPLDNQLVSETEAGFRVQGNDDDGVELVQLIGSDSTAGQGADQIFFSWSAGASDDDPCTLAPGEEFSTAADPQVRLRAGFHYIRLTVQNDLPPLETVESAECGAFEDFRRYDFIEVEIEVVD